MSVSDDEAMLSLSELSDVSETEADVTGQSPPVDDATLTTFILLFVLSAVAGFALIYSVGGGLF
jgi:hypothetical protein